MFSFGKKKYESINVNDLNIKPGTINLVDVREPNEYKAGHVPNAKNIPMSVVLAEPEKYLDASKEYHVICQSGARSSKTCGMLTSSGYKVVNVSGGTGSYQGVLKK